MTILSSYARVQVDFAELRSKEMAHGRRISRTPERDEQTRQPRTFQTRSTAPMAPFKDEQILVSIARICATLICILTVVRLPDHRAWLANNSSPARPPRISDPGAFSSALMHVPCRKAWRVRAKQSP
jgi:hypothetical protein